MDVKNKNFRGGITLIELMVTIVAAIILLLGITGILAAGHKNYKTMYNRTSQGVVPDAYAARRAFDLVVRKSTIKRLDPSTVYSTPSNHLYVYYYSDPNNISVETDPDKYGYFYLSGKKLILDTGAITGNFDVPQPTLPSLNKETTLILADNVNSVAFTESNHSITMVLNLDSETGSNDPLGTLKMTLTSTAIQHN